MSILNFLNKFFQKLSLGKYQTQLFHNKSSFYSTTIGGVLTLVLVSILTYFPVTMLSDTFNLKHYNL